MQASRKWSVARFLVGLMLVSAACGTAAGEPPLGEPPAEDPPAAEDPPPTEEPPAEQPTVASWTDAFTLTLSNGWTVRDCEGDRTHMCVWDGGRFVGDAEVAVGYPVEEELDADPRPFLIRHAEDFLTHFMEDRAKGCAEFAFEADDVTESVVGGFVAIKTGFTLRDAQGRVVERVVNHFTVHDGAMALVNTDAYVEEGGCLGPSEYDPSFAPEDLAVFERYLDEIVAAAPLPASP